MSRMLAINAALRFGLELLALLALGLWGFGLSGGWALRLGAGLGAPLVAVLLWGAFGAPAAPRRLPEPLRLLLELAIFAAGAAALIAAGYPLFGWILAVVAALNSILLSALGQR